MNKRKKQSCQKLTSKHIERKELIRSKDIMIDGLKMLNDQAINCIVKLVDEKALLLKQIDKLENRLIEIYNKVES